jgi:hypothetical protein
LSALAALKTTFFFKKECSIVTEHRCFPALLYCYALQAGLALLESLTLLITSDVYVLQELLKQRHSKYPCYLGVFVTYALYGVLCFAALFRYHTLMSAIALRNASAVCNHMTAACIC